MSPMCKWQWNWQRVNSNTGHGVCIGFGACKSGGSVECGRGGGGVRGKRARGEEKKVWYRRW
ncbi:hypothetical protein COCSADRAFT_35072 [Bipolaris sorokiniana ND90Pr]|uniref:Uncharacterized protein n=1 Tax=Cochliobolus sativus (strain ND90Pr / ATCC 201652) TaxID=665912 RepID=M2SH94_COCSN|nr:uncharacterized protein COCSADRAFT_35072 [Bipolaris sorokiniana ND90Pr]EMD66568.1 hypothetical protein COCSADRAFT_35072 [Bipolaris sorokiniana ND90Pr]